MMPRNSAFFTGVAADSETCPCSIVFVHQSKTERGPETGFQTALSKSRIHPAITGLKAGIAPIGFVKIVIRKVALPFKNKLVALRIGLEGPTQKVIQPLKFGLADLDFDPIRSLASIAGHVH